MWLEHLQTEPTTCSDEHISALFVFGKCDKTYIRMSSWDYSLENRVDWYDVETARCYGRGPKQTGYLTFAPF